jgi:hypothetical protein
LLIPVGDDSEQLQKWPFTTFNSILSKYGKDGKVLGLVVGYSGEASSDIHHVADLVVTRQSRVVQSHYFLI